MAEKTVMARRCLDYYEEAERRIAALGVSPEQARALREYGLLADDNVTGYHEGRFGNARFSTLLRTIRHVQETGEPGFYVEIDVRNLGGLNAAVGHSRANVVYGRLAAAVRTALSEVAAEAVFFRHGGDELSAFLVGTTEGAVWAAFRSAHRTVGEVAREFGVHTVPHPKHPHDRRFDGVGVRFGLCLVTADHEHDPVAVFRAADTDLERAKRDDPAGGRDGAWSQGPPPRPDRIFEKTR